MNKYWRSAGLYVLIFIVIFAIVSFSGQGIVPQEKEVVTYSYSDLLTSLREDDVKSVSITKATEVSDYGTAEAVLDDGTVISVNLPSVTAFMQEINTLPKEGSDLQIISTEAQKQSLLSAMLPTLILMTIMVIIMVVLFGRMQGGGGKMASFGKSRAKMNLDENNKVTFDNVAGCDEEKAELEELVQFLKNPKKFTDLGARIPKGVLLVGPPGTGKTLLAKAVAGEASVPFFSISGSDFVEMFVGVGASRVRDLFDQAKKNAPSIVFIDERWAGAEVRAWAADMMKESRH